ncbi:SDR family oxidoreductase [Nocardioides sambongensis]|uniref:SDR family oxidoreductase n=1 Tax=Nocardioides sambongensis TaxID=2589074 RepID=UPI0018C87E23|nr:SDR family oxidoreductase [Nocardioides sambongensis]
MERGEKALSELGSDRATYHPHDAAVRESWDEVVNTVLGAHGRIDGLVNNAGMNAQPVGTDSAADFERVLAVNLTGPFHGMQAVIPTMKAQGGGSIVNVSSSGGLMGIPLTSGYAASKWGMRGITRVAALELAKHKVRVNSVHPGMVFTPMSADSAGLVEGEGNYPPAPIGRVARAEEVSGAITYLVSDEATYTTGAEIAVDGAWTAGIAPVALLGPEFAQALLG